MTRLEKIFKQTSAKKKILVTYTVAGDPSLKTSKKILDDLEFDAVVAQVAEFSITSLGRSEIEKLTPYALKKDCIKTLNLVHEFVSSFDNENRIPNHGFDDITEELNFGNILSMNRRNGAYNMIKKIKEYAEQCKTSLTK